MNCRPGDLAMIVGSRLAANNGRIVRVLRYMGDVKFTSGKVYPDCWLLEGRLAERCTRSEALGGDAIQPDRLLRPIRDPGDDAQDESLAWLPPVPKDNEISREDAELLLEALREWAKEWN
jgi:hypothetical protein